MGFETKEDKIGRKEFVDKIAYCVDNLQEDQNMCIAIDGEWGSGKSFVMRKLYDRLNMNDNYLVVKYDAWECSYYDEPLIAVFSSILDSVNEKLLFLHNRQEGVKAVAKEIGKDLLDTFSKQKNIFGALATILKKVKHYATIYKKGIIIDTKNEDVANFHSYQTYLREVKLCMNDFTTFVDEAGNKNKLIILVDELDRCLPDMQLKILERLHHLFDVKNCAVICAINEASVAKNVKTTYGVDGYEYLRKFFDLDYKLEKSTEIYFRNLISVDLHNLAAKECNVKNWNCEPFAAAFNTLFYSSESVLKKIDNREATRFYGLVIKAMDEFGLQKLTPNIAYFIIIALFIRQYFSKTFLSEEEIKNNQDTITRARQSLNNSNMQDMPYYDYINDIIGFDRDNTPYEQRNVFINQEFNIAELIWDFNAIVSLSIKADNLGRLVFNNSEISIADCKRAREIVIMCGDKKGGEENA